MALINPAKSHSEIIIAAVAARDRKKAETYAKKHKIPTVHTTYQGKNALIFFLLGRLSSPPFSSALSMQLMREINHCRPSRRPIHLRSLHRSPKLASLRMGSQSHQSRKTRPPRETGHVECGRSASTISTPSRCRTGCPGPS